MDTIMYRTGPRPVGIPSVRSWTGRSTDSTIVASEERFGTPSFGIKSEGYKSKEAKKQKLRRKLKSWWKNTSREVSDTTCNCNCSTCIDHAIASAAIVAACPSQDYAALIADVIRRSPGCTRSTPGICHDIMKSHDWYKLNRGFGWQKAVAEELMRNPMFQPVVQCRKGVIVKNKSIKWRLTSQEEVSPPERRTSSSTFRLLKPATSEIPQPIAELPAIPSSKAKEAMGMSNLEIKMPKPVNRAMSISASSISPLSVGTASSPPHYSALYSARSDMSSSMSWRKDSFPLEKRLVLGSSSNPESIESRIASWMNSASAIDDKSNWSEAVVSPTEIDSSPLDLSPACIDKPRGVQLYDPPMDENPCSETPQQDDNGNSSSSSSPPNQQQNTTTSGSPDSAQVLPSSFGGRGSDDSDGNKGFSDDEDGNRGRKRKRFRSPTRGQNTRKFACVYHKYDPEKYGVQNRKYLVCAGAGYKYFSEVVRHLYRTHNDYICSKCLQTYDSKELYSTHIEECTARVGGSQEERWATVWRAKFPDAPVPQDPYLAPSGKPKPSLHVLNTNLAPPSNGTGGGGSSPDSSIPSSITPSDNSRLSTMGGSQQESPISSSGKGSINGFSPSSATSMKPMENRVDILERRIQFLEETLGLMLKMMRSMDNTNSSAYSSATPNIHMGVPQSFNQKYSDGAQPPMPPPSATDPGWPLPRSGTVATPNLQPLPEPFTGDPMEGDTLTPEFAAGMDAVLKGNSWAEFGIPDIIEKTNTHFLEMGNNNGAPQLPELPATECDRLLSSGHDPGRGPDYMDLAPDIRII
ncbi:hypothetical protein FQN54_000561 [Arachnomyces sp. PD_36]|nr:hypothetical protein FQN54_000561 [Arachnomyces sp. PD_36]